MAENALSSAGPLPVVPAGRPRRDPNAGRGVVIIPRKDDLDPAKSPLPIFRVHRGLLVLVELVVSAEDADQALAVSDLVLDDLGVSADCARILRVAAHGPPSVIRNG